MAKIVVLNRSLDAALGLIECKLLSKDKKCDLHVAMFAPQHLKKCKSEKCCLLCE